MTRQFHPRSPPAIVVGGDITALSVARSLWRAGVEVHALNHTYSWVAFSRGCRLVDLPATARGPAAWEAFLLGPESDRLAGSVIFPCGDDAIEIVIRNAERLRQKFILEETATEVREQLLDKLSTYRAAAVAEVPAPAIWHATSADEIGALEGALPFPLIIKPRLSHRYKSADKQRKYYRAEDIADVYLYFSLSDTPVSDVVLTEFIPGGDDDNYGYVAYLDGDGRPLAEYTKRNLRRYPPNRGTATYGISEWNPDLRELGLRFLRHVGLSGLAHVDFKRDQRDGKFKLIESNARFTANTGMHVACGVDFPALAYNRLTGRDIGPPIPPGAYRQGLRTWWPGLDFRAFLALRKDGRTTFRQWLVSVMHPCLLPAFKWSDPWPSAATLLLRSAGAARNFIRRVTGQARA